VAGPAKVVVVAALVKAIKAAAAVQALGVVLAPGRAQVLAQVLAQVRAPASLLVRHNQKTPR
jgi:hypothetical protein